MKKEKTLLLLISFLFLNGSYTFAQERSFKIVSNGQVVYSSITNDIDYVTVEVGLPTPANVACSVYEGNISIRWSAVNGATSYNVYRSADNSVYTKIGTSSSISYMDSSPAVGINYYKIQAAANEDQSILSEASSINAPETRPNGYEYVDLGLPSGIKWATVNLGASSPEDYGNYYAWGEIETKSNYTSSTSATYGKDLTWLSDNGYLDSQDNLASTHDVASQNWGGSWRMPTLEECGELVENCTSDEVTLNNVKGRKLTGPNGNSIFIPYSGRKSGTSLEYSESELWLWGATPDGEDTSIASYFYCQKSTTIAVGGGVRTNPNIRRVSTIRVIPTGGRAATSRYHGLPIRPVTK